jgi:hypothetical protein
VRRQHEADDLVGAVGERRSTASRSAAASGACPVKTGSLELGLERGPRRLGDLVQRVRVLDPEPAVARDEVLELLGP